MTITLPDNQTTPGLVSSVGTVATAPASGSHQHVADHLGRGHPDRPGGHRELGSGTGPSLDHHRQRRERPGRARRRAARPGQRWLRRRSGFLDRRPLTGAGHPRAVRRRRRARAGHRFGPHRRPARRGTRTMTVDRSASPQRLDRPDRASPSAMVNRGGGGPRTRRGDQDLSQRTTGAAPYAGSALPSTRVSWPPSSDRRGRARRRCCISSAPSTARAVERFG